jgi:hypothetical protein
VAYVETKINNDNDKHRKKNANIYIFADKVILFYIDKGSNDNKQ